MHIVMQLCSTVIAYKALPAGDSGATASSMKAESQGSGSFTFWNDEDGDAITKVGTVLSTLTGTPSLQDCLAACTREDKCAAAYIEGASKNMTAPVTKCDLRKGNSNQGLFIRTVIKTVITKLALPASLPGARRLVTGVW